MDSNSAAPIPEQTGAPAALPPAAEPQPQKSTFWPRFWRWAVIVVVVYALGLATVYFALYRPAEESAAQFSAYQLHQLFTATAQLATLQGDANVSAQDLQDSADQLATATAQIATLEGSLADSEQQVLDLQATITASAEQNVRSGQLADAAAMLSAITEARVAIAREDPVTAKLAIANAETYLQNLRAVIEDVTVIDGLEQKLTAADESVTENPEQADEALKSLLQNLEQLIERLQVQTR